MAKHALIVTVQRGEAVSITSQEFASEYLAIDAKNKLESQLAHSNMRLYTLVVQTENRYTPPPLFPR